jgi:hypothetical protein
MTAARRLSGWTLVCAALAAPGASTAQQPNDPAFRSTYNRLYETLKGVAPDMVVVELRDRVELIASRGSQVGSASNDRRVRGFEAALLRGLQGTVCRGSAAGSGHPLPVLIERVNAAATAQQLRTRTADVAELTAMAQRLLDSLPRERWCALTSLDDIR